MITVYSQPGCPRCRRIRQWFKENNIEYASVSLLSALTDGLSFEAFAASLSPKEMLADLESLDPRIIQDPKALTEWLQNNPSALNRPLIVCGPEDEAKPALESVRQYLKTPSCHSCPASCSNLSFCAQARTNDCAALLTAGKGNSQAC